MTTYTLKIDYNRLKIKQKNIKKAQKRIIVLVSNELVRNLKMNTPVGETGFARNSWHIIYNNNGSSVKSDVRYILYIDQGTGIYGPKHELIKPENSKVLRFKWFKSGVIPSKDGYYYFKHVKGIKPKYILKNGINKTKTRIKGLTSLVIREDLS